MATNEGFDGDPGGGLGFSHLLDSGSGGGGEELGFDLGGGDESFMYSSSFPSLKPSTMLCFSNNKQKSASESSSVSSSNNSSCTNSNIIIINNKSKRRSYIDGGEVMKTEDDERRNGLCQDFDTVLLPVMGFSDEDHRRTTCSNKKPKKEKPISAARPVKVRKEKIGERITALQQLVSPFGKTDTASVLHEAMGYIRFLHDQVQVLSSPYLQNMPSSSSVQEGGREGDDDDKMMMKMKRSSYCGGDDLRSRGLCLVPVDYTVHVADCNGADLWSPAAAMGRSTSTRTSNNNNNHNHNSFQPVLDDDQLKDPMK